LVFHNHLPVGGSHGQIYPHFEFAQQLFTDEHSAQQASEIIEGVMAARSPRLSDIAARMAGNEAASYKRILRFLENNDPQEALKALFNHEAEFVIANPKEVERQHAERTEYVGTMIDG